MKHWGCGAHCGDALWALSYLMRCKGEHLLCVLPQFVQDFKALAAGTNVTIDSTDHLPPNAEDTWIANGRHEGAGVQWACQEDIIGYVQQYFNCFGNAWTERELMLFDFPWLKPIDKSLILVLNTQPMSGQCPGYSQEEINSLVLDLRMDGHNVVKVVGDDGSHAFSLTQIACLSAQASMIIGGASGPFFVTMNTQAQYTPRIVLIDPMKLNYGLNVGPIYNVKNTTEARETLKEMNFFRYQ